jgi:hypothetical protein
MSEWSDQDSVAQNHRAVWKHETSRLSWVLGSKPGDSPRRSVQEAGLIQLRLFINFEPFFYFEHDFIFLFVVVLILQVTKCHGILQQVFSSPSLSHTA